MATAGLLDTDILIHWAALRAPELPELAAISTVTVAELAAGVHAARDPLERAARLELLQRAESEFAPLPFDLAAARAYGRVTAAVRGVGRSPRSRVADQMIAAIAVSRGLPLYTTDPTDYSGLDTILELVAVARPQPGGEATRT
ncbi:MAG: type II toxin-antitoxin system VapC family toxin [Bifidobacteriaceae bacterium]|jgi:predicted nucleic acid-binding protein|nr:type II toxin-antitoxin system VapC family toxin [Bifidobacteriaceae bacterium]